MPGAPVESRCMYPQEYLVVGDLGPGSACKAQDVGRAVPVLHDRVHRAFRRIGGLPYRSHDRDFPDGGTLPPYFVRPVYRTKYGSTIGPRSPEMPKSIRENTQVRPALSRDRVLRAAVTVADAGGIAELTIRSLAQELGVKPMSVYHY